MKVSKSNVSGGCTMVSVNLTIHPHPGLPSFEVLVKAEALCDLDTAEVMDIMEWWLELPDNGSDSNMSSQDIQKSLQLIIPTICEDIEATIKETIVSYCKARNDAKKVEVNPAVSADILSKLDLGSIVRRAVEDANIPENAEVEVCNGYRNSFSVTVDVDEDDLIREITQGIEDAISEEVEERLESAN